MYRSILLPLSCVAILNPTATDGFGALPLRRLTLNRISHGYLRQLFCDFRIPLGTANDGAKHNDESLKPWLSKEKGPSRSMRIEYNVQACQCDSDTLECSQYGVEPGSILSVCFWTASDEVELVRVSEMTMTQDDQTAQLISNGEANDFTTSETHGGTVVVHTLVFPETESDNSNVVVDGTVYFAPLGNDRELLVPEDGSYFRVEVPVLRHIPSKKSVRDALVDYLRQPDFAITFGTIIFLWVGLCVIYCNACQRKPGKAKKSEEDSSTDTEEDEESQSPPDEREREHNHRDIFPTVF